MNDDRQPLDEEFGAIDIYLFDQLLRGRIVPGMRVFDADCGGGRNLVYLLRHGYDIAGVDASGDAIVSGSRPSWRRNCQRRIFARNRSSGIPLQTRGRTPS